MERLETSAYPGDIATALRERWKLHELPDNVIPDHDILVTLLDTMYQASLLREENAPVQCQIVYVTEETFAGEVADGAGSLHVMRFQEIVSYNAHNVRKLAAAGGYSRALLAVSRESSGELSVWGMIVTSSEWVDHVEGSRVNGAPLPVNLVVQIRAPGHLVAASGYVRLLESNRGELLTDGFDPFHSQWFPMRFKTFRMSLLDEIEASPKSGGDCRICDYFLGAVARRVVRRVLQLVRMRGHGGILVFLPEDAGESLVADEWFRFRVRFQPDDSTFRFRRLMLKLLKRVALIAETQGLAIVTFDDYLRMLDANLASINEGLIEFSHLLANLMSVDGSLVVDHSFRLVGFGGEILGTSHVSDIHRALDLEAEETIIERADSSGTRHRAAYRLVKGINPASALVVSQDGDVRVVACLNQKVTYWPYLP